MSAEDSVTIIHYFIITIIAVAVGTAGVISYIHRQINNLKDDIEEKIDSKVKEIKENLEKQNADLKKGLQDKDERVRNLEISFGARLGAVDAILELTRDEVKELKQNIREYMEIKKS